MKHVLFIELFPFFDQDIYSHCLPIVKQNNDDDNPEARCVQINPAFQSATYSARSARLFKPHPNPYEPLTRPSCMEPLPAKVSCHLDALQSSTFRLNFNFADKNYTFSFQLNFVESFLFHFI